MSSIRRALVLKDLVIRVLASPVTSATAKYGNAINIDTMMNIKTKTKTFDWIPKRETMANIDGPAHPHSRLRY
jgi:hypothetical protein